MVLDEERVLNPDGLRGADEFVRHKALDAVGDLALAGLPLLATYRSYCGGHKLNVSMLRALFADPTAWTDGGGRRAGPRGSWCPAVAAAGVFGRQDLIATARATTSPHRSGSVRFGVEGQPAWFAFDVLGISRL